MLLFLTVSFFAICAQAKAEKATFAGGCFRCMTPPFEKLSGVIKVESGYVGGAGENPTYKDYATKGYLMVIEATYDPSKITYSQLLDIFWRQIDPTDSGGQFCDRGPQHRSAIFYQSEEQKRLAERSKEELDKSMRFKKRIVTEIIKASTFYKAEDPQQDYYKKYPIRYKFYRFICGRDQYLNKIWNDKMNKS